MLRYWPRFRLKTLMLLVAIVAGALALIVWMGDFGSQRWVARVQQPGHKLLLATKKQDHLIAFFEANDEHLVFFYKRLSGTTSHSGRMTILDTNGADLLSLDDGRNLGFASPSEGLIREWADEIMRNSSQGYRYPIRRGYRGKLRFKYSWDYVNEKQNILLDVTIPWRIDDAPH